MSDFNNIESRPTFPVTVLEDRLLSRRYIPASVKNSTLSTVRVSPTTITLSSQVVSPGSITNVFSLFTQYGNGFLVLTDWAIYVGSTSDPAANLFPGGTAVSVGNYKLTGPINAPADLAGVVSTGFNQHRTRAQLRNTSGSTQTVTMILRYRYIANAGDFSQ